MLSTPRALLLAICTSVVAGCSADVVVDAGPLCLDWTSPPVNVSAETNWGCSIFAPRDDAPLDPADDSPLIDSEHKYVCVERADEDAVCPAPADAEATLNRCWKSEEG